MKPASITYTWEDHCFQQLNDIFQFNSSFAKTASNHLDSLIDLFSYLGNQVKAGELVNLIFNGENVYFLISTAAIDMLSEIQDPSDFAFLVGDMHNLLVSKQRDYGTKNIMEFSHVGLIVRMFDKVSRLRNLLAKSSNLKNSINANSVPNESIIDTLMDLIGYSTIGLMIDDHDEEYGCKFLVPMKSNKIVNLKLEEKCSAKILSLDSRKS